MFPLPTRRPTHYLLLILAWAALCLVNLGGPSLWDIDEGNNAECSYEMYVSENWIVPTFNYFLRVDKPVLIYWLQMSAYSVFGVNEFSARLPSALAALLAMLLAYELGRRMFGATAGFLASLMLISTALFCGAAHFANPDALLNASCLLTLFLFWRDYENGSDRWLMWGGISTGLGMLAKGPVGLILPAAVIGLFLLWERRLNRLWRFDFLRGILLFVLVAVPWFAWVGAETKGLFLKGFFLDHNVGRFLSPMENHRGPVVYYVLILLVGFAPWSIFFGPAGWHGWRHTREQRGDVRYRFLVCWIAVYLVFFSLSRTKLPNYVLPIYAPLALMMAHFLDRWRRGEVTPPAWLMHVSLGCLAMTGLLTVVSLLVGGGVIGGSLLRGRHLPGMEHWAFIGVVPILAALASWWLLRRDNRGAVLAVLSVGAIVWLGTLFGFGVHAVDEHKAPRPLIALLRADAPDGDYLITTCGYFQPSLVFYCQHRIESVNSIPEIIGCLDCPLPSYAFMSVDVWEKVRAQSRVPVHELGRHRDLYRGFDVVLVVNRAAEDVRQANR